MKVTRSNTVQIELEDGDTVWDLYQALGELPSGRKICWVPAGHNRPALYVELPTDD